MDICYLKILHLLYEVSMCLDVHACMFSNSVVSFRSGYFFLVLVVSVTMVSFDGFLVYAAFLSPC